jgi:hypothetical protein
MMSWWLQGLASLAIALPLRDNHHVQAGLVLVMLGIGIMAYEGQLHAALRWGWCLPPLTLPALIGEYSP